MARTKRNRIFELFKSDFKITFFYKPSMENDDIYYYIVLDDLIKLHIRIIKNVVIIDAIYPITKSYIVSVYEKLVNTLMTQDKVTVLVSTMGDTSVIHQSCINHDTPLIDDEEYITVSNEMYKKWKAQNIEHLNKYGFYILSVSNVSNDQREPIVTDVKPKSTLPICKQSTNTNGQMDPIKTILLDGYSDLIIEDISNNIIHCTKDEVNSFNVEYSNNTIYIKDILTNQESTFNLIQVMHLLNVFENMLNITKDVFLINVTHSEVYRLCQGKGYQLISEKQKLPLNNLFKQAFHGYGTYKIKITN